MSGFWKILAMNLAVLSMAVHGVVAGEPSSPTEPVKGVSGQPPADQGLKQKVESALTDPKFGEVLEHYLESSHDWESHVTTLKEVASRHPKEPNAHAALGRLYSALTGVYFSKGDEKKGIKFHTMTISSLERALALDESAFYPRLYKGEHLLFTPGAYEEGLQMLDDLLASREAHPEFPYALVEEAKKMGKAHHDRETGKRAYLGVKAEALPEKDGSHGLLVKWVDPKGSAQKAGIVVDDVLLKMEDQEMKSMDDLSAILEKYQVGSRLKILILRKKEQMKFFLTLERQAAQ